VTYTVVDTGPLFALVDADDAHHVACRKWYESVGPRDLVVPAPVIAEACYLIGKYLGARVESAFLRDLARQAYGTVTSVTLA
jgi:predicted nucleic acid-binding protein